MTSINCKVKKRKRVEVQSPVTPSAIVEDTKPRPQDPFYAALILADDWNNRQPEISPWVHLTNHRLFTRPPNLES